MNTRRLLVTLAVLLTLGIAYNSRSTLTPKRGAHHVFYGGDSHFIGQYAVVGDFNNDTYDDVVTSAYWDDPAIGGVSLGQYTKSWQCCDGPSASCPTQKYPWNTIIAEKNGVRRRVCDYDNGGPHWAYWESLGWSEIESGDCNYCYTGTGLQCDTCYTYEIKNENQGALYVVDGASSWASKGHDIDFTSTAPSHFITGKVAGDRLYTGLAVGRINNDSYDDLLVGASGANSSAGEAYVIKGAASWSSTISLSSTTLLQHTFKGRDAGDVFGKGIAVGRLDDDSWHDIVVAAPSSSGLGNAKTAAGEIYVFYSNSTIPTTADLTGLTDNQVDALGYVSVIYGPADSAQVGTTPIANWHGAHQGWDNHKGRYEPVGLAIGDWDDDGFNDLAIGAGWAEKSAPQVFAGAVYVIFGTDPEGAGPHKLSPGNRIDLSNTPSSNANAPDMKFVGKTGGRLGAGVAFLDANDQGFDDRDDLMIGAPLTTTGGKTQCGEAYIIFGASRDDLLSYGRTRNVGTTGHVNVTIIGEDVRDRIGSQFEGNDDVDEDGNNDIGMVGEKEKYVFFVPSGGSWASSIDLYNLEETSPSTRMIEMQGSPVAHSVTIRFAHVDGDVYGDLVFGGYDNPGFPGDDSGSIHAGQMWVTKGRDLWKSGFITTSQTWAGSVFVNGDIDVTSGDTLTIAAGTDVWVWPRDPDTGDDDGDPWVDSLTVEFRVHGHLRVNGTASKPVRFLAWDTNALVSEEPDLWWGIHVQSGSAVLNYCEIRNAYRGLQSNVNTTLTNSTIEDCEIIGLSVANAGSVYVSDTTIRGCETGINALQGTTLVLSNSVIEDCSLYGVAVYKNSKCYASASTFDGNDTGLYLARQTESWVGGTVENCTFTNNGDGIWIDGVGDSSVVIDGCIIDDNTTNGIYIEDNGDVSITDNTITGSAAGVFSYNSDPVIRSGNTIQYNTIGVKCDNYSAAVVESCTVTQNYRGVWVGWECTTDLGGSESSGRNILKPNTARYVMNFSSYEVAALWNYWPTSEENCNPESAKLYGPVDASEPLCDAPSLMAEQWPAPAGDVPTRFTLSQNYPNPFNPTTTIAYQVPKPGSRVEIALYDVAGRLVARLVDEHKVPGSYAATWSGQDRNGQPVATGVYFLRMRAGHFVDTKKLVLLK